MAMKKTEKDGKIYTTACKIAEIEPNKCIYVGNDVERDIKPAYVGGLNPIKINWNGDENFYTNDPVPHMVINRLTTLLHLI